ncbi:MAG: hypothetical protein QXF69_05110 [Thermofilaceae archaeon]
MPEVSLLTVLIAAAAAAVVGVAVALVLARRRGRAKNKRERAPEKWSALVDWRGLIVEAQGSADSVLVAYVVQAARVLEEMGKLSEMRARVGELTIEVTPQEEGLYRVVAR